MSDVSRVSIIILSDCGAHLALHTPARWRLFMMTTPLVRLQRLFGFGRGPEALTPESSRARLLRAKEVTPELVRDHVRIVAAALPRVRSVQPQDIFNVAITLED